MQETLVFPNELDMMNYLAFLCTEAIKIDLVLPMILV